MTRRDELLIGLIRAARLIREGLAGLPAEPALAEPGREADDQRWHPHPYQLIENDARAGRGKEVPADGRRVYRPPGQKEAGRAERREERDAPVAIHQRVEHGVRSGHREE